MKNWLFTTILAFGCLSSFCQQAHMTIRSGLWNDPATWDTRTIPKPNDFAIVRHKTESVEAIHFGAGAFLMIGRRGWLCAADSVILTCGSRFENHGTVVTPLLRVRDGANTGWLYLETDLDARGCNYAFEVGGEIVLALDFCYPQAAMKK